MKTSVLFPTLLAAAIIAGNAQAQYDEIHIFLGGLGGLPTDGQTPYGSVILSGDTLFGTTLNGGSTNMGTVYSVRTNGNNFALLHSFTGGFADSADGDQPLGGLLLSGGVLYGLTSGGGGLSNSSGGTVFSIDTNGSNYQILHSFTDNNVDNEFRPVGSLMISGSTLYGVTSESSAPGGIGGFGTVFKMDTSGNPYQVLHNFAGGTNDGSGPVDAPLLNGSTLYGVTGGGGSNDLGTVYSMDTSGNNFQILHSFNGGTTDGDIPDGPLVLSGSALYGVTFYGGISNMGTVYSIDITGSGFHILHHFIGGPNDSDSPQGALTLSGATLYGSAYQGNGGNGAVFQMNTNGSGFQVLRIFGTPASNPNGALVLSVSTLYGTAASGDTGAGGDVFSLSVNGGAGSSVDLAISKTDSPDPVAVGSNLTYTIVVTNRSAATAASVTVTDSLPASVTFVSASAGCTNIGGEVICDLGAIDSHSNVTKTIVVTPTAVGSITNTAVVSSSTTDSNSVNNTATAVTTVTGSACVDLTGTLVGVKPSCKVKGTNTTCKLSGSLSIQNHGTVVSLPGVVRFYLSSDAVLDNPGDRVLPDAAFKAVKTTKAGKAKLKVTLPVNVLTAGQFVIAVIDAGHANADCVPSNNVVVFGPLP